MQFIYINCTVSPCLRPVPYIWICQWDVGALICGAQVSSVRCAGTKFQFNMHCGIVLNNFRMSHVHVKQSRIFTLLYHKCIHLRTNTCCTLTLRHCCRSTWCRVVLCRNSWSLWHNCLQNMFLVLKFVIRGFSCMFSII